MQNRKMWVIVSLFMQTGRRAMRLEMRRVHHQPLRGSCFSRQRREDTVEYPHPAPAHETVIQRLGWAVFARCILPWQPVADDINDAADDAQVVHARNPGGQRKIRRYPLQL